VEERSGASRPPPMLFGMFSPRSHDRRWKEEQRQPGETGVHV